LLLCQPSLLAQLPEASAKPSRFFHRSAPVSRRNTIPENSEKSVQLVLKTSPIGLIITVSSLMASGSLTTRQFTQPLGPSAGESHPPRAKSAGPTSDRGGAQR